MPEWYNWRQILQRPGQETSTIGDKPNEYSYQLEVPEFKIPTVTNSEYSIEKGLATRKAKDVYDAAYKEYLEQHPSQTSVGYNPYIGTQYNPEVQRQQAAHLYAQNKSGYYASDPTAPYKESDRKFAKFSEGVLGTMLFAPELAYGLGGAALRIGGGMAGGAVGGYVGSEAGKALDNTFKTNFWQPTLGIVGGLWGWGKGARLGYNAGLKGIQFGASKGFVPHDWLASQKMKLDALRNAGFNWESSKDVNKTLENVPKLQGKPLQLTGHFGNPDIRYSKGNPTGSEIFAERYDGNPLRWNNINKDISVGRTEAINYLNSKRKQLTDQHNIDIAKRLFNVDITPEPNPGIRASTDMQFTSTPILNGTWYPKFGVRLTFDPNNTTKGNTVFNYRDPTLDEISLDLSSDLEDAALHEWLHRGNIGEGRGDITRAFYKWKTQKLLKPEFWNDEYFGNPQEATTNLIEIGRRNGITNAKYPGFNKAIEQLRYIIDNDINKGYLLNKTRWETKPKRVWDALQGKYMGLIPIGLGTTLMLNENE